MKRILGIVCLVITIGLSACYNTDIKKPKKLIPKDKFVKMMVDIYLAQGMNFDQSKDSIQKKITSTDLYYSVLKKYHVPDTTFIRSLIYYMSFPKEYEKMNEQIMNVFKEAESQYKPNDKLNPDDKLNPAEK